MKKRVIIQVAVLLLAIVVCFNYNIIDTAAGYIRDDEYIIDDDESSVGKKEEDLSQYDWIVAKDGSGDFTTIQEACEAASEGDSIYIKNGTYYEWVVPGNREDYKKYLVWQSEFEKNLNLVGESREGVILQYNYFNYYFAPLFMNEGSIQHMTIYASEFGDTSSSDEFLAELNEYINENVSSLSKDIYNTLKARFDESNEFTATYALHIDSYENPLSGGNFTLKVTDCTIKSDVCVALGMGLHSSDNITFTNCTIWSGAHSIPVMYVHDSNLADQIVNYRASNLTMNMVEIVGNVPARFEHISTAAKTNLFFTDVSFKSGLEYLNAGSSSSSFEDIKFTVLKGGYTVY